MTGVQPHMGELAAAMLVLAGGVAINTVVGLGATCAALFCKVRVWVHPRLRSTVRGDLSSVTRLRPFQWGLNHAVFVVATAVAFPVLSADAIGVAALTFGKARNEVVTVPIMVFEFVAFLGGPLATIPCYCWLSSRIIARSPQECWPRETLNQGHPGP